MNLLRNNYTFPSICWDFETEGLNLRYSRPWQLSYVYSEGQTIKKRVNKYLWWPDLQLSEGAQRTTRFDSNYYKSRAEDPKKVYEEFAHYIYNDKIINIGQYILGYDIYILNTLRRLLGKKEDWSYLKRLYDTSCLGKFLIYTNPLPILDNKLIWQRQLLEKREKGKKVSLSALGKHFGIVHNEENLHDASVDSELNFEIFKKMILQIEI